MNNEQTQPVSRSSRLANERGGKKQKAPKNQGPKKSHKVRNWILSILLVIVLVIAGLFGYAYMQTKSAIDKSYVAPTMKKARDVSAVLSDGKPVSLLLLGTDTGALGRDYKGRTDSIMIVTINPKTDKTTIMSIPRDTLVAIDGYEDTFPQKINAAYAYGSAESTIKTIQDWLNIPIDFYALVNMGGMEKVVNKVGGITVTSPLTFAYNPETAHANAGDLYSFTQGSTTWSYNGVSHTKMTGKAALAFSRMRYDDPQGDYGRQERQRLVLQGIVDAAKSNPTKLLNTDFLNSISSSMQTDLSYNDMLAIATKYSGAANNVKNDHIQGTGYSLTSGSTEVVSSSEQQRATNVLRKALGLPAANTGNLYGGNISTDVMIANGVPTE